MRTVLTLLILLAGISCNCRNIPKNMAGLEIGTAIRNRCMKISFCHGLTERWSVGGTVSFNIRRLGPGKTDEMKDHENEFIGAEGITMTKEHISDSESVVMQFWPMALFEGMFIMAGGRHTQEYGLDCVLGIGYLLPVWKGLSATVSLETGLIRKSETSIGECIALGISYKF